jgi:hypothetical protein
MEARPHMNPVHLSIVKTLSNAEKISNHIHIISLTNNRKEEESSGVL